MSLCTMLQKMAVQVKVCSTDLYLLGLGVLLIHQMADTLTKSRKWQGLLCMMDACYCVLWL